MLLLDKRFSGDRIMADDTPETRLAFKAEADALQNRNAVMEATKTRMALRGARQSERDAEALNEAEFKRDISDYDSRVDRSLLQNKPFQGCDFRYALMGSVHRNIRVPLTATEKRDCEISDRKQARVIAIIAGIVVCGIIIGTVISLRKK